MRRRFVYASVCGLALAGGAGGQYARGQAVETRPAEPRGSEIRDAAKMFEPGPIGEAKSRLESIERRTGVPVFVETEESTKGPVEQAAARKAEAWGKPGIYVLIDKTSHKLEILASPALRGAFDRAKREAARNAMIDAFKAQDFTKGLLAGITSIGASLDELKSQDKLGHLRPAGGSELVVRNQVRLNLAGARLLVEGAEAKAAEIKTRSNIAVVDDGGHLILFSRMDGARPASGYTAITKAASAATFRRETGPLPDAPGQSKELLNLSLQNAAEASGGKISTLYGGIPVVVDGQVIGAVGVGGGSGEQDADVAKAGVAKFLSALGEPHATSPGSADDRPAPR